MAKRLFDVVFASLGLLFALPVMAIAACGIKLTNPGPIFYLAPRMGRDGKAFVMYKLRTMRLRQQNHGSRITGVDDDRIFALGKWLRDLKLDELPQLFNVIRGDMSIVGPRPEDPEIVRRHYTAEHRQTLRVRPGLASPGTIYNYVHGDELLAGDDPETAYATRILSRKLELDLEFLRHSSLWYDLHVLAQTARALGGKILQSKARRNPPEMGRSLPADAARSGQGF